MKKYKLLCVLLPAAVLLAGTIAAVCLFAAHGRIQDTADHYQPVSLLSSDGQYLLETSKFRQDDVLMVTFTILPPDGGGAVYTCPSAYRASDLKSIRWAGSTLDVVVVSGDAGTVTYSYTGGTWQAG